MNSLAPWNFLHVCRGLLAPVTLETRPITTKEQSAGGSLVYVAVVINKEREVRACRLYIQ
jgi:hypothetical protein